MEIPSDQKIAAQRRLPGMEAVKSGDWLTIDAAYTEQLATKETVLSRHKQSALIVLPQAENATIELRDEILRLLRKRDDFAFDGASVIRPDGKTIRQDDQTPLIFLSQLIQEDICIMQKLGANYILTGALLCFPASWTLSEKIGKALVPIHRPVKAYDGDVAKRVERLFEGVKVDRPIWRANLLPNEDPTLYQPRLENAPKRRDPVKAQFMRSERQTLLRLPISDAVIFAIHTSVEKVT